MMTVFEQPDKENITFEKHFIMCIVLTTVWHPNWYNMFCVNTCGTQTTQIINRHTETKRQLKILTDVWIQDEQTCVWLLGIHKKLLMWIYTQKITYKTYDTFKNKNIKSKVKYREK